MTSTLVVKVREAAELQCWVRHFGSPGQPPQLRHLGSALRWPTLAPLGCWTTKRTAFWRWGLMREWRGRCPSRLRRGGPPDRFPPARGAAMPLRPLQVATIPLGKLHPCWGLLLPSMRGPPTFLALQKICSVGGSRQLIRWAGWFWGWQEGRATLQPAGSASRRAAGRGFYPRGAAGNAADGRRWDTRVSGLLLAKAHARAHGLTGCLACSCGQAPEVLAGTPYSIKADVFSFGIVLWEVSWGP